MCNTPFPDHFIMIPPDPNNPDLSRRTTWKLSHSIPIPPFPIDRARRCFSTKIGDTVYIGGGRKPQVGTDAPANDGKSVYFLKYGQWERLDVELLGARHDSSVVPVQTSSNENGILIVGGETNEYKLSCELLIPTRKKTIPIQSTITKNITRGSMCVIGENLYFLAAGVKEQERTEKVTKYIGEIEIEQMPPSVNDEVFLGLLGETSITWKQMKHLR